MKIRTAIAGLLLAVAFTPTAVAAPKDEPAPAPIVGSSSDVEAQFFCQIFTWMPMCHPR